MKPFFSLIVPCYNVLSHINKGLSSIENQTYKDFEIIFIDDCSIDNTYNYLLEYKIKSSLNIKVIKNQKNSGPGESRNRGIEEANGEYITFMDSDDWLEPNFFMEFHKKIESSKPDLVMCDYFHYYKNQYHWIKCSKDLNSNFSKTYLLATFVSSLWNLAIKKELFSSLRIPSSYNAEDVTIIPQLVEKANKICFVHCPLYVYQYRPISLSKSTNASVVHSFINGFISIKQSISKEHEKAIEFIGIKMILYGAVFNAIRIKLDHKFIIRFIDSFTEEYPNCMGNEFLKTLPLRKRIFIKMAVKKQLWMLYLYLLIQRLILS